MGISWWSNKDKGARLNEDMISINREYDAFKGSMIDVKLMEEAICDSPKRAWLLILLLYSFFFASVFEYSCYIQVNQNFSRLHAINLPVELLVAMSMC